jgi:hypothetical protein
VYTFHENISRGNKAIASIADQLNGVLHRGSPFENFDASGLDFDPQGWFEDSPIFDEFIDGLKPQVIIEVGSWKGTSAMHMAKRLKQHVDDFAIICIDTWLGAAEAWMFDEIHVNMNCINGYPSLYRQFMYNMIHEGLEDHIVPLPLPSAQASLLLQRMNIKVPLVYIDAGHDYQSVSEDIKNYWPFVLDGGVMFGDDYGTESWPGVTQAVTEFQEHQKKAISGHKFLGSKWAVSKKTPDPGTTP